MLENPINEYLKFGKSIPTELGLCKIKRPSYPDCVLDDSHIHYPKPRNKEDLEQTLDVLINKLDRSALTVFGGKVKRILGYRGLADLLKNNPVKDYSFDDRGVVGILKYKDKQTEVYTSQEIRTNSHLHITAEGCESFIPDDLDPRKTVELIHKQKGIAIVEHPSTKVHPVWQYVPTSEEDDKLTLEVFDMVDCAEVFNSYNTLWMPRSNARAKELVKRYNDMNEKELAGIAGSDIHYGTGSDLARKWYSKHIGNVGIFLHKHDTKSWTGREIIELKRKDLKEGNYERFENYCGPFTFFVTMIPPIVKRKLGTDMDSVS